MLLGHWLEMRSVRQASSALDVVKIFELSRASYRKMRQNLAWVNGYNIIAIPAAAGEFRPFWSVAFTGPGRGLHVGQHGDRSHQRTAVAQGEAERIG
jgi:cation transport ATPase